MHKCQVIIKKSKQLYIIEIPWQLQHELFIGNVERESTSGIWVNLVNLNDLKALVSLFCYSQILLLPEPILTLKYIGWGKYKL